MRLTASTFLPLFMLVSVPFLTKYYNWGYICIFLSLLFTFFIKWVFNFKNLIDRKKGRVKDTYVLNGFHQSLYVEKIRWIMDYLNLVSAPLFDPPGHGRIGGHYFHAWCPSENQKALRRTPCMKIMITIWLGPGGSF